MTEDLISIDGVGDAIAEQLRDAGYETVDAVEGGEPGDATGEHDPNTLTEDHIPDIAGATARETADILEERLRGR